MAGTYHAGENKFFLNNRWVDDEFSLIKTLRHQAWHAAQDAMPGHVKVVCRAGSMLAFDTRCAHTAFANTSATSRDCIIWIFCPKWQKQRTDVAALADTLNSDGLLDTSFRRQLFGLEDASGAIIARRGFL